MPLFIPLDPSKFRRFPVKTEKQIKEKPAKKKKAKKKKAKKKPVKKNGI